MRQYVRKRYVLISVTLTTKYLYCERKKCPKDINVQGEISFKFHTCIVLFFNFIKKIHWYILSPRKQTICGVIVCIIAWTVLNLINISTISMLH